MDILVNGNNAHYFEDLASEEALGANTRAGLINAAHLKYYHCKYHATMDDPDDCGDETDSKIVVIENFVAIIKEKIIKSLYYTYNNVEKSLPELLSDKVKIALDEVLADGNNEEEAKIAYLNETIDYSTVAEKVQEDLVILLGHVEKIYAQRNSIFKNDLSTQKKEISFWKKVIDPVIEKKEDGKVIVKGDISVIDKMLNKFVKPEDKTIDPS